jgi:hypothetical protein
MPISHLNDHTAEASRSRLALVREGLQTASAVDRPTWIRAARARIGELEQHKQFFGLEPFEQDELDSMRELLKAVVAVPAGMEQGETQC